MGTFAMIILPNVLQLFVSIAYFMLDALLTAMLGAPRGAQRSTYYLSLPYRYSFPLLIASAVLHWLVSQSLFFVQIISFDINDVPIPTAGSARCGYSPVAMLFAIIVGSSLLIILILLSLHRFESPMPLVAQCSAAISAACHPMTSSMDDAHHALKPVQWGEIPGIYSDRGMILFSHRMDGDEDASGGGRGNEELQQILPTTDLYDLTGTDAANSQLYHCTFSSEDVCEPREGRAYM
ncbi:hypothetical protein PENFLA_c022G07938 [Penicillium flavigenum]|uniref:Uncharacterized protein n=1 Tax=Penicillium flavigenum TaxID=254877 RepID=A0A1V6SVQ6_9EURO|nr:hypothetical protein PENFLA_c022G07938 [Penicillium flavigenum]